MVCSMGSDLTFPQGKQGGPNFEALAAEVVQEGMQKILVSCSLQSWPQVLADFIGKLRIGR